MRHNNTYMASILFVLEWARIRLSEPVDHPPKSRTFNQEEGGVGLGQDKMNGGRKHEMQAEMKEYGTAVGE